MIAVVLGIVQAMPPEAWAVAGATVFWVRIEHRLSRLERKVADMLRPDVHRPGKCR
jgi:hypothetical protein